MPSYPVVRSTSTAGRTYAGDSAHVAALINQHVPPIRSPSYISASSWMPHSDSHQSLPPPLSSSLELEGDADGCSYTPRSIGLDRTSRFANEYTSGYGGRRAAPDYVQQFDAAVNTGPFSRNLYTVERIVERSRSRSRFTPLSLTGQKKASGASTAVTGGRPGTGSAPPPAPTASSATATTPRPRVRLPVPAPGRGCETGGWCRGAGEPGPQPPDVLRQLLRVRRRQVPRAPALLQPPLPLRVQRQPRPLIVTPPIPHFCLPFRQRLGQNPWRSTLL